MSKAFGEQNPTQGEDPVSWQTWSDGTAEIPNIIGNVDWGKLSLQQTGAEGRSLVYDLGSSKTRTFTLTENRYGTGAESATIQIRGDTSLILQDDLFPVWETYTVPISKGYRYVQVRAITAISDWWLSGGIDPNVCVAAWSPFGAGSYANSKVNLADPGTHDAVDGVAPPTWDSDVGWIFDAFSSQYLTTDIVPDTGWTMICSYKDPENSPINSWVCGVDSAGSARFYLSPAWNRITRVYGSGGYTSINGLSEGGVMCIAGQQPYYNGETDGTPLGVWSGSQSNPIFIGCLDLTSGLPGYYFEGSITSMAIYNTILTEAQVAAVTVAMPGAGITGTNFDTLNGTIDGQGWMILLPETYNSVAGAPLVVYHHGAGETETGPITETLKWDCVRATIDAGYIISATNGHGGLGDDACLADNESLYSYCDATYNITRVVAWGQSMGGMATLNDMVNGVIPYKGSLLCYAGCDLRWMYDNGFSANIKSAYGIAGDGSDYDAKTAGHDPVLMSADDYIGFRLRFYASAGDAVISKTHNTDEMETLVAAHATECVVVACTGTHGDPSHFVPTEYVDFFDRCI
jgi:hypothetical protein